MKNTKKNKKKSILQEELDKIPASAYDDESELWDEVDRATTRAESREKMLNKTTFAEYLSLLGIFLLMLSGFWFLVAFDSMLIMSIGVFILLISYILIKILRGWDTFSSVSIHSILKRKEERDIWIKEVRNKKFPVKIINFDLS